MVQTGRIDPILSPDQVSGHVHKFAGGSSKLPDPRPEVRWSSQIVDGRCELDNANRC